MTPVDFQPDRQLTAAMTAGLDHIIPSHTRSPPNRPPSRRSDVIGSTVRMRRSNGLEPGPAVATRGSTAPLLQGHTSTGAFGAEDWVSPALERSDRLHVGLASNGAPNMPQYNTRKRGVSRGRTTTLDFFRGMPVRAPCPDGSTTDEVIVKATRWQRIPPDAKERTVATRAALQLERFAAKLPEGSLVEMDAAMSHPPVLGGTGLVRRPTPMFSTTKSPGHVESLAAPCETETMMSMRLGRTGVAGVVTGDAFPPQFGDGGTTGVTMGGSGILRLTRGTTADTVTRERCQPVPLRTSGLSTRPPLRVSYLEPTATIGLISPVRATKFTSR
jgi:hypothetical protein